MSNELPDVNWQTIRALHATSQYTFDELEKLTGVGASTIRSRASRDNWNKEKAEVLAIIMDGKNEKRANVNTAALQRLPTKENFRTRVAQEVEKVIAQLNDFPLPQSDREADLRLSVLEKVEKVGAKGYGLEEKSGPSVLINLTALSTDMSTIKEVSISNIGSTDVATFPAEQSNELLDGQ